eukprot:GAFH01003764.1.p1 GENE.GAFH01003764.1~~GAFH01003764.1.p1  ORF type:complete len:154 (-),score=64.76 GAFH01003764.1:295-756(-)
MKYALLTLLGLVSITLAVLPAQQTEDDGEDEMVYSPDPMQQQPQFEDPNQMDEPDEQDVMIMGRTAQKAKKELKRRAVKKITNTLEDADDEEMQQQDAMILGHKGRKAKKELKRQDKAAKKATNTLIIEPDMAVGQNQTEGVEPQPTRSSLPC